MNLFYFNLSRELSKGGKNWFNFVFTVSKCIRIMNIFLDAGSQILFVHTLRNEFTFWKLDLKVKAFLQTKYIKKWNKNNNYLFREFENLLKGDSKISYF